MFSFLFPLVSCVFRGSGIDSSRVCFAVVLCLYFLGGGSGFEGRRTNPVRDTRSKRLRTPSDVPEGSNPQRRYKTSANKRKESSMSMEEMPATEFMSRRKQNPYGEPREHFPGDEIFWTKQQFRIYH